VNSDRKEFEEVVNALKAFNGYAHPHIVTLLITWTHQGQYYLLFPLPKCDLDQYWELEPNPVVDTKSVRWMSEQLAGITSAVEYMHDPTSIASASTTLQVPDDEHKYSQQGDLRPQNILLYDSRVTGKRTLVIADMGLSKPNSIVSKSMQSNSRIAATLRYTSPELEVEDAKVTQLYDVWTLGCLILEWACWLLEGQSTRKSFINSLLKEYKSGTQRDMFFDMKVLNIKNQVVVKDEVVRVSLHSMGPRT
jgi:serine/threonine protein kinase